MILLGICDYLAAQGTHSEQDRPMDPHMESAIIAVVRRMALDGLKQHPWASAVSQEMVATTVSWALYGAAKEWISTPNRCPSEEIADAVVGLVSPLLHPADPSRSPDAKGSSGDNANQHVPIEPS